LLLWPGLTSRVRTSTATAPRPGVVGDPGMCGSFLLGNRQVSCSANDARRSWSTAGKQGARRPGGIISHRRVTSFRN
jgi:hypothetical protein